MDDQPISVCSTKSLPILDSWLIDMSAMPTTGGGHRELDDNRVSLKRLSHVNLHDDKKQVLERTHEIVERTRSPAASAFARPGYAVVVLPWPRMRHQVTYDEAHPTTDHSTFVCRLQAATGGSPLPTPPASTGVGVSEVRAHSACGHVWLFLPSVPPPLVCGRSFSFSRGNIRPRLTLYEVGFVDRCYGSTSHTKALRQSRRMANSRYELDPTPGVVAGL
jgi:hypothetical protein